MNVIKLQYGQKVRIIGYAYSLFTVGSIEGYAKQYNENPFKALKDNQKRAKENQWTEYCIAWINKNAACISASQHFRDQAKREFEESLVLQLGEIVEIEGRRYKLQRANNDNVFCAPVGRAAYGHPKRSRYAQPKAAA